ncbi:MAG: CapA family protein [Ruminococcaceae bacterium]|nr:CapA family protein [Oscillospiraceae bacterium]
MKKSISLFLVMCVLATLTSCGSENKVSSVPVSTMVISPVETMPEPFRTDSEKSELTTDVITPPEKETFNIKLSFAGDVLLAAFMDETKLYNFNDFVSKNPPTYFLEKVRHVFDADDFTVVNLENVFTDRDLLPIEKDHDPAYWYKSKTSNVEILTSSGVDGVSLVNNHMDDYGAEGFEDTYNTVKGAGLYAGTADEVMYLEKEGFTVAVICTGLWSVYQANSVQIRLDAAKENSDYQIIFFHGGTEMIHEPEQWKIDACRKLVDGGADLVIGSHPHILQPMENYNGVDIIYSLGNFCFGDWYRPENRTIIYQMDLTIDRETMVVKDEVSKIIPCYVHTGETRNNYQPAVIENEDEINRVMSFMRWECDSPVAEEQSE